MSEDPIGFEGRDANLSAYVGNGPVNGVDPNGLSIWESLIADAIKDALGIHGDSGAVDVMEKKSRQAVNDAVKNEIVMKINEFGRRRRAQIDGFWRGPEIPVTKHKAADGDWINDARLKAGLMGFDNGAFDEYIAKLLEDSAAGRFQVEIDGKMVVVKIHTLDVRGKIRYYAWLDHTRTKFSGAWWRYDHFLYYSGVRGDTGEKFSGEELLFWESGVFNIP